MSAWLTYSAAVGLTMCLVMSSFTTYLSPVLLWYLSTVLSMDTEVELDTSSGSREFDVWCQDIACTWHSVVRVTYRSSDINNITFTHRYRLNNISINCLNNCHLSQSSCSSVHLAPPCFKLTTTSCLSSTACGTAKFNGQWTFNFQHPTSTRQHLGITQSLWCISGLGVGLSIKWLRVRFPAGA